MVERMTDVTIGKVIKSNTHVDYLCQVYGPREVDRAPAPSDYALGTFVRVPLNDEGGLVGTGTPHGELIGVIYDTVLHNPEFGNLGPRLSSEPDLQVFTPDYLAEKVTLVGITTVGMRAPDGAVTHGIPALAAQIDAVVTRLAEDAVRDFHRAPDGGVRLEYAPMLVAQGSPLARHLLLRIVDHLGALFPEEAAHLSVLRAELAWQTMIAPMGGVA
jgi:hypothetical protein